MSTFTEEYSLSDQALKTRKYFCLGENKEYLTAVQH